MKDDLDELLKSWRPRLTESPAFKRQVWRRIERDRGSYEQLLESLAEWFVRPRIVSVAAVVSMLAGAWIGFAVAEQDGRAVYLHSVDPYAQISLK